MEKPEDKVSAGSTQEDETQGVMCLNVDRTSKRWSYAENYKNEYYQVEVQRDFFSLDESSAARYPELNRSLRSFCEEAEAGTREAFDSLKDTLQEMVTEGIFVSDLEDKTYATVLRADDTVFSFREQNYSYYGGAHGGYGVGGRAYDVQTGRQLSLSDIVADGEELKALTAKQLDETYGDIFFEDVYAAIDRYALQDFTWELDNSGVTLIFNQYELAPYAEGVQFAAFSYAEYPDLLDAAYFNTPETYVQKIEDYVTYRTDVDGDGETEAYEIRYDYADSDIQALIVVVNGKEYQEDVFAFDTECYFVKCRDAGYLYLFPRHENDYVTLEIFDFAAGQFRQGTADGLNLCLPGTGIWKDLEDGSVYLEATSPEFLHPEHFLLSSNLSVLSTYQGTRAYHVGKDGIPVADEPRLAAETYFLLKTKTDVPCKLVKPDGTIVEENSVIPAGTFFQIVSATRNSVYAARAVDYVVPENDYLFRTDENTKLQTDVLYFIELDEEEGGLIGGVSIMELFDGLNYTG